MVKNVPVTNERRHGFNPSIADNNAFGKIPSKNMQPVAAYRKKAFPITRGIAYQRNLNLPCAVSYVIIHPATALNVVLTDHSAINPEKPEYGCHNWLNSRICLPSIAKTPENANPTIKVPAIECVNILRDSLSLVCLDATIGNKKAPKAVPRYAGISEKRVMI
jgi:hypothetical protein